MNEMVLVNANSLYLIEHHLFEIDRRSILVDVRTLKYFEITDLLIKRIIKAYEEKDSGKDFKDIFSQLLKSYGVRKVELAVENLIDLGLLLNNPQKPVSIPDTNSSYDLSLHTMLFNISHACNFSCSYCFAGEGLYLGKEMKMSKRTADAAIDFLISNSNIETSLGIELFGGEPLLNFSLIKLITKRIRRLDQDRPKPSRIAMPTNGLLLTDEVLDFCDEVGIRVQISMDGPPMIHNRQRKVRNLDESYNLIIENVKRHINRHPMDVSVRTTVGPGCIHLLDISKHLLDELKFAYLSLIEAGGFDDVHCKKNDIEVMKEQWLDLAFQFIVRAKHGIVWPVYPLEADIRETISPRKKTWACGAGKGYLTVTSDGTIYPCPRFIGKGDFILGNVFDGLIHPEVRQQFYDNHVDTRTDCMKCWARYFCGGRCVALPVEYSGNLKQQPELYCDLYRRQYEIALYVNAVLSGEGYVLDPINKTYYQKN